MDAGDKIFQSIMKVLVDYVELELGKSFLESWEKRQSFAPALVVEYLRLPKWKRKLKKSHWNRTFGAMCLNDICKSTEHPEYCDWARRLRTVYLWYIQDYKKRPENTNLNIQEKNRKLKEGYNAQRSDIITARNVCVIDNYNGS